MLSIKIWHIKRIWHIIEIILIFEDLTASIHYNRFMLRCNIIHVLAQLLNGADKYCITLNASFKSLIPMNCDTQNIKLPLSSVANSSFIPFWQFLFYLRFTVIDLFPFRVLNEINLWCAWVKFHFITTDELEHSTYVTIILKEEIKNC